MAADNLMAQGAHEKRVHAEKKKKRQEEKEAEEEHLKAERETMTAQVITATISPPADMDCHDTNYDLSLEEVNLNNSLFAMTFAELIVHGKEICGQSGKEAELYAENIEKQKQAIKNIEQQALCLDTKEAEEYLAHHGMRPNYLFETDLDVPT